MTMDGEENGKINPATWSTDEIVLSLGPCHAPDRNHTEISFVQLLHCLYGLHSYIVCQIIMFLWRSNQSNNQEIDSLQQDEKIKELRNALGPLSGRCLKYSTDACLRRYLEARYWNVDKAKNLLEETLKWRAVYKPEEIRWHQVAQEGETGKISRANFHDCDNRTVLIMRPGKQNSSSAEGNIRHLVYMIENAILNLPEGQGQMSWLIDFSGWSLSNCVPVKTARETAYILQNHYPERLGIALLYNPPRIFEAFYRAVKYFLDPKTSQKVKFVYPNKKDSVELMTSYFDAENLPTEFGGKAPWDYDHEEFSKLMVQDDVKAAKFWGLDDEPCSRANGLSGPEADPESIFVPGGHSRAKEVARQPVPAGL